jgi:hypothetical protein
LSEKTFAPVTAPNVGSCAALSSHHSNYQHLVLFESAANGFQVLLQLMFRRQHQLKLTIFKNSSKNHYIKNFINFSY